MGQRGVPVHCQLTPRLTAPAALTSTFDETMNYTLTDGALTTQSTFRVQVVNTPPVPQNDE